MTQSKPVVRQRVGLDLDGIRQAIDALCRIDERVSDAKAAAFRPGIDPQRAVGIRTHAHHAARLARSILVLDEQFEGAEVVPNVRLLFECAVTAAWLLITPGSGHTLLRDGAQQWKKALDALREIGEDTEPGYQQAQRTLDDLAEAEGPRSYAFEQRCRSLEQGAQLYSLYRILSAESHAGMGVADLYVRNDDASPIGVSFNPHAVRQTRESTLGIAACMLLMAMNADELASAKPRHSTQIDKLAKRLRVGTRIIGKNGYELPPRGESEHRDAP